VRLKNNAALAFYLMVGAREMAGFLAGIFGFDDSSDQFLCLLQNI
jgi:hypothetical protein